MVSGITSQKTHTASGSCASSSFVSSLKDAQTGLTGTSANPGLPTTPLSNQAVPAQPLRTDARVTAGLEQVFGRDLPQNANALTYSERNNLGASLGSQGGQLLGAVPLQTRQAFVDPSAIYGYARNAGQDPNKVYQQVVGNETSTKVLFSMPDRNGQPVARNLTLPEAETISDGASAAIAPLETGSFLLNNAVGAERGQTNPGYTLSREATYQAIGENIINPQGAPASLDSAQGRNFVNAYAGFLQNSGFSSAQVGNGTALASFLQQTQNFTPNQAVDASARLLGAISAETFTDAQSYLARAYQGIPAAGAGNVLGPTLSNMQSATPARMA
jgi:hypothetical protein